MEFDQKLPEFIRIISQQERHGQVPDVTKLQMPIMPASVSKPFVIDVPDVVWDEEDNASVSSESDDEWTDGETSAHATRFDVGRKRTKADRHHMEESEEEPTSESDDLTLGQTSSEDEDAEDEEAVETEFSEDEMTLPSPPTRCKKAKKSSATAAPSAQGVKRSIPLPRNKASHHSQPAKKKQRREQ